MPPRYVGPWEILSVVGRGGVGTVYRARHRRSGEPAAVKLLGPAPAMDPTSARRLAREFEALQALVHPNVVRVHGAGVCEGYSWLAMELVEGLDLRAYLSPAAPLAAASPVVELGSEGGAGPGPAGGEASAGGGRPEAFDLRAWAQEPATDGLLAPAELAPGSGVDDIRAFADLMEEPETDPGFASPWGAGGEGSLQAPEASPEPAAAVALAEELNRPDRLRRLRAVLAEVLGALDFIHGRGFVHRDIKPSNIMVDDDRHARIMDFGLVKSLVDTNALTLSGRVVGTYRYMAPEQAAGQAVDRRADLWSMGVILYELLAGRPPFTAQVPAELWREITTAVPPDLRELNPAVDPALAAAVERLLRKEPGQRFGTAREVLGAIGA